MTISLAAEPLAAIGSIPITNSAMVGLVVFVFLVGVSLLVRRKVTTNAPHGLQNVVESLFELLLSTMDGITQDRAKTKRFFPFVATAFFYILFSNWTGLLPGLGSFGIYKLIHGEIELVPFLRAPTADLNFTIALAVLSVLACQWYGMRMLGAGHYWGKFFVPPWKPPYVIGTFVGLLELVSEFAKIISFSFRLFGNIFAGEILLLVVGTLAPMGGPLPFLLMEILVGVVQALVFSLLTTVFLSLATTGHGEETHAGDAVEEHLAHEGAVAEHMAAKRVHA